MVSKLRLILSQSVCLILAASAASRAAASAAAPNIVLMMADDLSWGETGYNGLPREHKPDSFDGGWRGAKGEVYEGL